VLDLFEDIDRSTGMLPWLSTSLALTVGIPEYRVKTLYPYDGQRAEDLLPLDVFYETFSELETSVETTHSEGRDVETVTLHSDLLAVSVHVGSQSSARIVG
jgi:hypothetical protein